MWRSDDLRLRQLVKLLTYQQLPVLPKEALIGKIVHLRPLNQFGSTMEVEAPVKLPTLLEVDAAYEKNWKWCVYYPEVEGSDEFETFVDLLSAGDDGYIFCRHQDLGGENAVEKSCHSHCPASPSRSKKSPKRSRTIAVQEQRSRALPWMTFEPTRHMPGKRQCSSSCHISVPSYLGPLETPNV